MDAMAVSFGLVMGWKGISTRVFGNQGVHPKSPIRPAIVREYEGGVHTNIEDKYKRNQCTKDTKPKRVSIALRV
jgi:hypothetical protein